MNITEVTLSNGETAKKGKYGKVAITIDRNKYRLRFYYLKKKYCLTIGTVCNDSWKAASAKAQLINADMLMERFDPTLVKYSPERAIALGIVKEPTSAKVSEKLNLLNIWDNYQKIKDNVVQQSTKKHCWSQVLRCIKSVETKYLSLDKASEFLAALLENYSVGTIRTVFGDINAAVNLAVEMKLIEDNPYKFLKLPKRIKQPIECFEDEEIRQILIAFKNNIYSSKFSKFKHSHYYEYIATLALTFARPEEIIALKVSDIKYKGDKTYLKISKAYSKGFLQSSKTKEIRLFNCNEQLKNIIFKARVNKKTDDLLFSSQCGAYIDQSNFRQRYWVTVINSLVEDGKLHKYLKPYSLRHSGITRLIRNGYDIATVASLAGNSTEMICKHYLAAHNEILLPEL